MFIIIAAAVAGIMYFLCFMDGSRYSLLECFCPELDEVFIDSGTQKNMEDNPLSDEPVLGDSDENVRSDLT